MGLLWFPLALGRWFLAASLAAEAEQKRTSTVSLQQGITLVRFGPWQSDGHRIEGQCSFRA